MTIWQERIEALKNKGMKQAAIANECGCTAGAISLLASGGRKQPNYDLGARIVELCKLVDA